MKSIALILALATAHVAFSSSHPSAETMELLAANEVDPQWEFPTGANGPIIKFNGTVEALYAYVSNEYPSYIASVFEPEASTEGLETREDASGFLEKRTDFSSRPVSCELLVSRSRIREGIDYLRRVRGQPSMEPNRWSRVSCSYDSAISWINTSNCEDTESECSPAGGRRLDPSVLSPMVPSVFIPSATEMTVLEGVSIIRPSGESELIGTVVDQRRARPDGKP